MRVTYILVYNLYYGINILSSEPKKYREVGKFNQSICNDIDFIRLKSLQSFVLKILKLCNFIMFIFIKFTLLYLQSCDIVLMETLIIST